MRTLISVDDGHPLDMRVFSLLKNHGLEKYAIFFIPISPTQTPRMGRKEIIEIAQGSNIGSHTVTHRVLTKLPADEQRFEISEGRRILQNMIGRQVNWFAPPRGWTNQAVESIAEECGVDHYRLMKQGSARIGHLPFMVPISVHFHPYHLGKWPDMLQEAERADSQDGTGYFHVTCHGWELEKFGLWKEFEDMLSVLKKYI